MKTSLLFLIIGLVVLEGASALTCLIGTNCDTNPKSCKEVYCEDRMDECAYQSADKIYYGCLRCRDCNAADKGSTSCAITDATLAAQISGSIIKAATLALK
ncbi:uncharacterized protein LOC144824426 [Lissotriton helveticus]